MSDAELILIGGLLLASGIGAALVADRVRVPGLVLFLGLGMLVGSDGIAGVEFNDVELTRTLGTIGLVLILFEGGLTAGWREIRPVLPTAVSLAVVGTIVTALIAGFAATALFDLTTLEGMIVGSAVAATDSAAIFAVLRNSNLNRRLARSLEGESGLNDPVAVLLVTGFISWIQDPSYGLPDMLVAMAEEMAVGLVVGVAVGYVARRAFVKLDLPTPGLYPVASMAAAAIAFGLADVGHGSGFLAVYLAGLVLGTGIVPARTTVTAFHQGLGWVAQISLFFLLGLLVIPSQLGHVAFEGITLSLLLIFVARPVATMIATQVASFTLAERAMLSWAGLRGAVPIWLATLPVIAGVDGTGELFNLVFFVVISSTLIQGFTFEPFAHRLGVTSNEPALPQPLIETGTIQELGGDVFAYRVGPDDVIAGRVIKELGLPRQALVNLIVRDGQALLPRGSTVIEAGDELHILVRRETRREISRLTRTWREGPLELPTPVQVGFRGSPQVFSVRPTRESDGDTGDPTSVNGIAVARVLRTRSDTPAAVVLLADGRFAVTGPDLIALGGRRNLARWCAERAERSATSLQDRAWLQEAIGVFDAPGLT
ncbi:MAG: potassium/proton antiporter [Solirubrobacterales bacterium]|nr:potassium/proton antiporter [Solirubrobacterales bacterium]MCB8970421.1 potassium/proton antiporter [Thermoleophilales bacterium]MCO5325582.1 potassium/proton antiporter [Solirubrobacterales bacterium]